MNERRMLVDTAGEIFRDTCTPHVIRETEGSWLPELWETLVDLGFTHIGVPEELGGLGGTFADAAAVVRVAASSAAPVPLAETLLAGHVLATVGLASDARALTIVGAGTGLAVEPTDAGARLAGRLRGVPWARAVEQIAILADELDAVVLIDVASCQLIPGNDLSGEPRDDLYFADVEASAIHELGGAWDEARLSRAAAVLKVSQIAGALEHISKLTLAYVNQREQFKRRIGSFQAVQHQIATLAGITAAVGLAAEAAAEAPTSAIAAAAAKAYASHACGHAALIAHQLHGAIGFTQEHELQLFTRRIWSWRDECGNEAHWATGLTDLMLASGADEAWPLLSTGEKV